MAGLFTPPASGAATLQRAARDAAPDARWLLAVSDRNGIVSTSATTCNYPPAAKDSAQDGFRHALAAAIAADIDEALRHGYGDLLELAYPLMSWPRRGVFGGPTPAPRGLATRQCPPRTVHVDRVRPNGAERELRARFRPILRPQFTLGDGANGLPLAACTKTGAYVPHLPYSPIAVDPQPSAGQQGPS
ncbi:hypothetical protein N069_03768 [Mycobacterium tuberculosis variant africanum MAL010118]|nr:hypothetical protein GCL30_13780 [Mycobacterium tuberculosis]KBE34244.1 hypothetical protein AP29_00126 [Mycobacterium tuberculosis H1329]KBG95002.1 hypothetical protein N069_03768 [Mycobacterium tuberculosis variant africanum MAL010118]QOM78022.1 hypothetical protein FPJ99_19910 [Mycobacterium tuberculosis]